MPTVNPRVNVTLSPSLDSLVTRLAAVERVSKSMVLRELLESAVPALSAAVAMMEAAKGASAEARERMLKDMEATLQAARGVEHLALMTASSAQRDMVGEAEAIKGRRPARGTRASPALAGVERVPRVGRPVVNRPKQPKRPPVSNRGVK